MMRLNQTSNMILIFSLLLAVATAYAEQSSKIDGETIDGQTKADKIPFYLPIYNDQFPGLIKKLESALNAANLSNLKLTTVDYWHPYQNGIRQGRPGVYFAAPHFASWLVNNHSFDPTLRLSGKLRYVIVARRSDSGIFEVGDLANKTVCTNATMDLSFLLVRESMARSVLSAETLRVQNVAAEMKANNKNCDAFSLSEHLFLEFATKDPFQFIRLQQSKEFANYAYLLHASLTPEFKRTLRKFLVSQKAKDILQPMYRLFSEEPVILGGKPNNYQSLQMELLQPYWATGKFKSP